MKIRRTALQLLAIPAFSLLGPQVLSAEVLQATSQLSSQHEVAANWGSSLAASGEAQIEIDPDMGTLVHLVLDVAGIVPEDLANAGPNGILGPIHFHNYPQGGPRFFALQLPGTISRTDQGLRLEVTDWKMDAPMVGKDKGLTAAFVIQEIRDGNAYIGLHTLHEACPKNQASGVEGTCAVPGTALSGHIEVLTYPEGETLAGQ